MATMKIKTITQIKKQLSDAIVNNYEATEGQESEFNALLDNEVVTGEAFAKQGIAARKAKMTKAESAKWVAKFAKGNKAEEKEPVDVVARELKAIAKLTKAQKLIILKALKAELEG